MRIGFIGLGAMGEPMARTIHLARPPGAPLLVHARREESAAALLTVGAAWAATPAAVARDSDVLITMLPDLAQLRSVLAGADGILAGLTGPLSVVACSTSSPTDTQALGAELAAATDGALTLLDAPVSGGVEGARAARLSIFLGGPAAPAARVAEVLSACGTCTYLGPLGSGQAAKAANQHIVAATTVALAEALLGAHRAGLDLAQLVPLLAGGYAGSRLLEVKGENFITGDHPPASPARFMIKDLAYAMDQARATGTPAPTLAAAQAVFTDMVAAGLGELDSSGVQEYLARVATGQSPRP